MVGSPCSIGVRRIAGFCSYWKLHPHGSFGFHYAPFPCRAPLECCAQSWHTRWPSKDEPCPWFISYFLGWKKLHWQPLAWKGLKQLNSDYSTYELGVQGSCCMSKAPCGFLLYLAQRRQPQPWLDAEGSSCGKSMAFETQLEGSQQSKQSERTWVVEKHFRGHSSENMIFNSCIYACACASNIYWWWSLGYTSERKQKTI